MRGVLVRLVDGVPVTAAADLTAVYQRVAERPGRSMDELNLGGASRHGDQGRWFNRGNLAAGGPSASVDVPLHDLVAAVLGRGNPGTVPVARPREYDLGEVDVPTSVRAGGGSRTRTPEGTRS